MTTNTTCAAQNCKRSTTCRQKTDKTSDLEYIVKINPLLADGSCCAYEENGDWDEKRMDIIGSNGNDGAHYD